MGGVKSMTKKLIFKVKSGGQVGGGGGYINFRLMCNEMEGVESYRLFPENISPSYTLVLQDR